MPKFISSAVEAPKQYLALDSENRVWKGPAARAPGEPVVITWEAVISEFPESAVPARLTGGVEAPEEEDE